MIYFRFPGSTVPLGMIPLVDCSMVEDPKHLFEKENVFKLVLGDQVTTVFLSANSPLEKKRWLTAFRGLQPKNNPLFVESPSFAT